MDRVASNQKWESIEAVNGFSREMVFDRFYQASFETYETSSPRVSALILRRESSSKLLVVMPAAQGNSATRRSVYFQLWQHQEKFSSMNMLCLSDPAMKTPGERFMSYGLHKHFDSIVAFADVVKQVARELEVESGDIVFYGISQGGFLSAQTACLVKGSSALVQVAPMKVLDSAQTNQLSLIRREAFDGMSWDSIQGSFSERLGVLERVKSVGVLPRMHLITNRTDFTYPLMLDFLDGVVSISEDLDFIGEVTVSLHPTVKGHSSISVDEIAARVQHLHSEPRVTGVGSKSQSIGDQLIYNVHLDKAMLDQCSMIAEVSSTDSMLVGEEISWLRLGANFHEFDLELAFQEVSTPSKQAVLIAFSLHGARNRDKDEINLHHSKNKSIGWFRYMELSPGKPLGNLRISVPKHCYIDAIGIRSWGLSDTDLKLVKIRVSEI